MAQDSRFGGFDRSWKRPKAFTGVLRDEGQIRNSARDVLLALVEIAERNRTKNGPARIVSVSAPRLAFHMVHKMHERTVRGILGDLDKLGLIQYRPGDGRTPSWIDLGPFLEAAFAHDAIGSPYLRNHKAPEGAHAPPEWNELDELKPEDASVQGSGDVPQDLAASAPFMRKLNFLADGERAKTSTQRAQAALRARRDRQWEQCRRLGQQALLECDPGTVAQLARFNGDGTK